jgi:hypothetical protein
VFQLKLNSSSILDTVWIKFQLKLNLLGLKYVSQSQQVNFNFKNFVKRLIKPQFNIYIYDRGWQLMTIWHTYIKRIRFLNFD